MKLSVLVIAHNEEARIARCIESLFSQSREPDEIVVICHNCTDKTADIAGRYPVRVITFDGNRGPEYARLRGLTEVSGDIVCCIDGDAYAATNWVEVLCQTLTTPSTILAGSWVRMQGTLWAQLAPIRWYASCAKRGFPATDWLFGASFAYRKRDTDKLRFALTEGIRLSKQLRLPTTPDDYWIALFLSRDGVVEVTNRTWVMAYAKEHFSIQGFIRGIVSYFFIRRPIRKFIKQGGIPGLRLQ